MDKKAKDILFKTYWQNGCWTDRGYRSTNPADFEYAKEKGLMFEPLTISHDDCVKKIIEVANTITIEQLSKAFLSSLSTRRLEWRSGIGSYHLAKLFFLHKYKPVVSGHSYENGEIVHTAYTCGICKDLKYGVVGHKFNENEDLNVLNFERIKWGGVRLGDLIYTLFDLEQFAKEQITEPTNEDIEIFKDNLVAEYLHNPVFDKRFQAWTKHHLYGENLRTLTFDGVEVFLPPVNFDALYIFNHAYVHFIDGGVGLRQLCDWALYLHAFRNQIDRNELLANLKSFGLLRSWQIFGHIAVEYLGLPKDEFPFYSDEYEKLFRKVLDKIMLAGNFGFHNPHNPKSHNAKRGKRTAGYLSGKIQSLFFKQKWAIEIFAVFPKEMLVFYVHYWIRGIGNIIRRR